jgi:hypothetical protein
MQFAAIPPSLFQISTVGNKMGALTFEVGGTLALLNTGS